MKNIIKFIILILLLTQNTTIQAQIVGGRDNGQQAPTEAKAAELSKGGVSGDVNLFNGTFGTSYDLGTVSTPGGLSYTATMSYSSSFASGDNLPHTSGIPYGEGWNLDVPTISISTEDYNQYSLRELTDKIYTGYPDVHEEITFDYLEKEGRLMWFAPTLNIPGVASGRMVYKYTDREGAVFVLHKFERYIEARFDGQYWTVTLDDGTVYEFLFKKAQQRNANNRRTNWTGIGTNEQDILKQIIPKIEETTWYINKISHPNRHGAIHFYYDTFGRFDMYKEFKQHALAEAIKNALGKHARINLMKNVYKDIFLREINAGTEKLEFKHRSLLDHNLSGVYKVNDTNTTRLDSLYTSKVVKSWGGTHPTPFNGSNAWNRYKHLKAKEPYGITPPGTHPRTYGISSTNPYQGSTSINALPHLYRESANGGASLSFDHGFLESPAFGTNLPPGDMYEIRADINGGFANFDINIVTGDKTISDRYVSGAAGNPLSNSEPIAGPALSHAPTWQGQRNEVIYSTFNQAIKWNPRAGGGNIQTSNYFTMPNLPAQLRNMRIQIGPANSDIDYAKNEESMYDAATPDAAATANAYLYNRYYPGNAGQHGDNPLLHGHNITANFGIGMPWHMVAPLYAAFDSSFDFLGTNGESYKRFWWNNNNDPADVATWNNVPTLAESSTLASVELIHHAKNPYMLYQVKHFKLNGTHTTSITEIDDGWQLTNKLQFEYDDIKINSFASYETLNGAAWQHQTNTSGTQRNIILLKNIKQMPISESGVYHISKVPTTHFEYVQPSLLGQFSDNIDISNYYGNLNVNLALLQKIVDPLGKETSITYDSTPEIIANFSYIKRPDNCHLIPHCRDTDPVIYHNAPSTSASTGQKISIKRGRPYAFTLNAIVKNKTITDADGTRQWDYTYGTLRTFNEYPPMQDNISWDKNYRTKYGYSKTTVQGPYLTTGRPYTEYYHYNFREDVDIRLGKPLNFTENEGILWGKLYKVKQYDENDKLISQTQTEYDFHKAFIRGSQRVKHDRETTNDGGHSSGHDYVDMIIDDYLVPDPVMIYDTQPPSPPVNISDTHAEEFRNYCFYQTPPIPNRVDTTLIRDWIDYYRNALIPYYESGIAGGYKFDNTQDPDFIKRWTCSLHPFDESYYPTTADYDTAVVLYERYEQYFSQAGQIFREHFYSNGPDYTSEIPDIENEINAVISYEREYEHVINQWHPYYLDSYFIKTTKKTETAYDNTASGGTDSIQTITDYEYYDADHTGKTNSEGYDIMLYGNADWQQLQWEPSWQLYKTQTHSPQHPDAFNQKEYFYYYDLMNREDMPIDMTYGLSKHLQNLDDGNDGLFYPVQWTWKYRMRNIAFEERTTSKAPSKNAVSTSSYFTYSNDWNDVNIFSEELDSIITINACDTLPIDSCSANIPSNCHRPRDIYGVACHETPMGFYSMVDDCGKCWWCWDGTIEPQGGEEKREINLGFPHKDNLFYASTFVKTKHEIEADYNSIFGNNDKYAILRFVPDSGSKNNFLPEFPYDALKTHEVLERNMYGAVQLEADEKNLKTRYEYSGVKTQTYNVLCYNGDEDGTIEVHTMNLVNAPTSITVGAGLPDSLTTHYRYHPDYSIDSIIDPNGKVLSYDYDKYGRLENTYLNGDKTGEIAYSQWNNNHNKNFQHRMLDNYVQTTTFNDAAGNKSIIARAYVDPLGRSAITATHKSATPAELVMAGGIDYDNWDRQTKLYKPYMHSGGFAGLSYGMHSDASTAHAQNQYENTPRSRVLKSAKYGIAITDPDHTVDNTYALMTSAQVANQLGLNGTEIANMFPATASKYRLMRTQVTDEDGKTAKEYSNAFGQKVATLRNDGTHDIVTLFYYDSQGQLVKVTNPEKQHSTYSYNPLGQLYQKTTVDNGTTRYVYNKSGQITYEQDAKGDTENYMRAYRYDEFGRNVRQDKYNIQSSGSATDVFFGFNAINSMHWLNPKTYDADASYASKTKREKYFYYGNKFDETNPTISDNAKNKLASLNNEKGQLTHSISYNEMGKPIEYRFMSYNDEGYLDWEVIQFHAEGISATATDGGTEESRQLMANQYGNTTIIDLPDYNLQGSLMTQNVDLEGNDTLDFQYHYAYDDFNRLEEVYVSYTDDREQGYKVASYAYDDALGLVKEVKYYASDATHKNVEVDVITHSYDIRDRLTELDAALFNWKMFYDDKKPPNAQNPTQSWNGNINATVADYKFKDVENKASLTDFVQSTTYAYTYDGINRLTAARATGVTGQANLGNATYSYDKIGNLKTLNRHILDATNNSVQLKKYIYEYLSGTNQLLKVEGGVNRYTYDQNGNMVSDAKKNLNNTIYGRANLPSRLEMTSNTTTYIYDANDMRIYKKVDSLGTIFKEEYYLRDATGRELAVIDNNYNINWYIYGKERVASMQHEMPVGLEKLFITGNIPSGKHYAAESLKTDGTVQSDATLEAGDKVSMLPGFDVPAGAEFKADIKKPDGIPNFIYYLYDHLGNTRVTYHVDIKSDTKIDYTVESASDYYPYGKALRSYGKERYQSTYHERDLESGFDYRGARFYDADVARFNSLDPLAADYPGLSDYVYVAGNPLMFVDPDGRKVFVSGHLTNADGDYIRDDNGALIPAEGYAVDENGNYIESQESLLIMHRSPLQTDLSDKYTNVWKVTFSLKVGNRERKLRTPDGTATMYMFGNKKWDGKGSNYLPKKTYKLKFETMTNRPYTNSIRITSFGVFIHPASTYEPIFGCKGLCATYKSVKDDDRVTDIFFGKNTKDALQQVRALYDIYEKNLTGDKFILKTNSEAPKDLGMPVKPLINK